ncbi:MAG: glycine cleavage system protein GcvH [Desulfobia sp.]
MKKVDELNLPDDLQYTQSHEWARSEGEKLKVGLTDYAQDQMGEVVFVELPSPGESFRQKEVFSTVESVKAVAEVYMPVGGKIALVNESLRDDPEMVNRDPYGQGWLVEIEPDEPSQVQDMFDSAGYRKMVRGG